MRRLYDTIFNSKAVNVYISLIVSIVVVQRYDSYFSLVQIIFIFTQFFIKQLKSKIAVYIVQIVFNYYRLIVQIVCNIQYDKVYLISDTTINNYRKLEFKRLDYRQMEYFIQIINILLVFNMIQYAIYTDNKSKSQGKDEQPEHENDQSQNQTCKMLVSILNESLFLISFLISIFILFWVSLYAINIVHFILALYFVFILLNLNTNIIRIAEDKSNKLKKYWFTLIIFTQLIILLKYFTEIYLPQQTKEKYEDLLEFLGVDFNYNFPFKIGLTKEDFGSNTLLWILYIFSIKFYISIEDSSDNIQQQSATEKLYNRAFNIVNIIYHKVFFYAVYLIFLGVLVFMEFNCIKLLILIFLMIPLNHFLGNLNCHKLCDYYTKQLFYWNLLMIVVCISTFAIYFYQFFETQLISKISNQAGILKFLNKYQFIGFVFAQNKQNNDKAIIKSGGLKTLIAPYYLFVLISVLSKKQIRLIISHFLLNQNKQNIDKYNVEDLENEANEEMSSSRKSNHIKGFKKLSMQFSIRQNDLDMISRIINKPFFDWRKYQELIKVLCFIFKCICGLQMVFILLMTRDQVTLCSFIMMILFTVYNWQFVLTPEKFYNSRKMIDDTNKYLEMFKQSYLKKESFKMVHRNDDQIIDFQYQIDQVEQDYLWKRNENMLNMNQKLVRMLMVLIVLTFISKVYDYQPFSNDQRYELLKQYLMFIGIFDQSDHQILTFFSIIWMGILNIRMLMYLQQYRGLKYDQVYQKQESEQRFIDQKERLIQQYKNDLGDIQEVEEFVSQTRVLNLQQSVQDCQQIYSSPNQSKLDNQFQIQIYDSDEKTKVIDDYVKKSEDQENGVEQNEYFNYYKLQSFYKNQKFYKDSIVDQIIIVLIEFIGIILCFVIAIKIESIYEMIILLMAMIQLKISSDKTYITKGIMFIILQIRYIGALLVNSKVTQNIMKDNFQRESILGILDFKNDYLLIGIYIFASHLCLQTKFKITKQISIQLYKICIDSKKIDYEKVEKINLNYSQWKNEQTSITSSLIYFVLDNYFYMIFFMMMLLLNNQSRNLVGLIQIVMLLIFVFYEQWKTKDRVSKYEYWNNQYLQNQDQRCRQNTNRRQNIQMQVRNQPNLNDNHDQQEQQTDQQNQQEQQSGQDQEVEDQQCQNKVKLDDKNEQDNYQKKDDKQKYKLRFIFIFIMQVILGVNYFINSTSDFQTFDWITKHFKVQHSNFNSLLMIVILTFTETLIRVLRWPFMISYMKEQRQDLKISKILRCYLVHSNKNKHKIDKIYEQEFNKNRLMMNVEILTQKYQQLFNTLENNKNSVQQNDIDNILKSKQGMNDSLIDQSGSQVRVEDVQFIQYKSMSWIQKIYSGLSKLVTKELKDNNIQLYNRFLKQNKKLIDIQKLSLTDYITQDYDLIKKQIYHVIHKQHQYFASLKLIQAGQSNEIISAEIEQLHDNFIHNNRICRQSQDQQDLNNYEQNDLQFLQIQLPSKLQMFNFNVDDSYVKSSYSFQKIVDLLIRVILSKQVYILLFVLLFYRFYNYGVFSILPVVIILFLNFIQQSEFKIYYYFIIYILISIIILAKYIFQIQFIRNIQYLKQHNFELKSHIYIGESDQFMYEVIIIVLIVARVQILKLFGLLKKQKNYYTNSFQQFFLNILNEDHDKNLAKNLKKMEKTDEANINQEFLQQVNIRSSQVLQKQFLNHFQIQSIYSDQNYFYRNFSSIVVKYGVDYYSIIFTIQMITFIYILCFYKKMMVNNNIYQQTIADNRFDGNLITPLILQILVMIIDRVINQCKNMEQNIIYKINISNELIKFIFLIFQVIFIVVYLTSISQNNSFDETCTFDQKQEKICYYLKVNIYQNIFYLLYFVYFIVCAFQIRYGYPKENRSNSLIEKYNYVNLIIFYIFQAIPFAYEIKILIDWTITNTSLTVTQWLQVSQIQCKLFVAKVFSKYQQMSQTIESIAWYLKFLLGFCGLLLISILILGPVLLYSSFNPIGQVNPIKYVNIEFGIQMNRTHKYELYHSTYNQEIRDMNQKEKDELGIDHIKFSDNSIFQRVSASPFSEVNWDISTPARNQLSDELDRIISSQSPLFQISFFFRVKITRKQTKDKQETGVSYKKIEDLETILHLRNNINNCSYDKAIRIDNLYKNTYRLISNYEPFNLNLGKDSNNTIYLRRWCDQNKVGTQYWTLVREQNGYHQKDSIYFYTVGDTFNMYLSQYSLSGFYFSIVYLVFTIIRQGIQRMTSDYTLTNLPYPDNLIKICKAIEISRQDNNLQLEYTLYWYLMDLLRSPEIIKMMTGSYYKIIGKMNRV